MNPVHLVQYNGRCKKTGLQLFDVLEDIDRDAGSEETQVNIYVTNPLDGKSYAARVDIYVSQGSRETTSGNRRPPFVSLLKKNEDELTELLQTAWRYDRQPKIVPFLRAIYSEDDCIASFELVSSSSDFISGSAVFTTTAGSQ